MLNLAFLRRREVRIRDAHPPSGRLRLDQVRNLNVYKSHRDRVRHRQRPAAVLKFKASAQSAGKSYVGHLVDDWGCLAIRRAKVDVRAGRLE